ncbi:MAG: Fur family transcriptional regulator [Velocimicrobium sp.]
MGEHAEYEEKLKKSGLKSTKHRKAILDVLVKSNQPMAAEQIYLTLKESKIDINMSTVYRTLESLEQIDLITKISIMDDDRMLFEYNKIGHRHYLVCVGCKKIITIKNCPLGSYEKELESETDFEILGHKLYLYGYCSECQGSQMNSR